MHPRDNNIYACGTVRKNKKFLPKDLRADKDMSRGNFDWRMTKKGLVCLKWIDKNTVYFLSNYYNPEQNDFVHRRQKDGSISTIECPSLVADYNKYMGFVDKVDMLKKCYVIDRKSKKWYHRIIWHFLDTTIVNSFIIYRERSEGKSLDY